MPAPLPAGYLHRRPAGGRRLLGRRPGASSRTAATRTTNSAEHDSPSCAPNAQCLRRPSLSRSGGLRLRDRRCAGSPGWLRRTRPERGDGWPRACGSVPSAEYGGAYRAQPRGRLGTATWPSSSTATSTPPRICSTALPTTGTRHRARGRDPRRGGGPALAHHPLRETLQGLDKATRRALDLHQAGCAAQELRDPPSAGVRGRRSSTRRGSLRLVVPGSSAGWTMVPRRRGRCRRSNRTSCASCCAGVRAGAHMNGSRPLPRSSHGSASLGSRRWGLASFAQAALDALRGRRDDAVVSTMTARRLGLQPWCSLDAEHRYRRVSRPRVAA